MDPCIGHAQRLLRTGSSNEMDSKLNTSKDSNGTSSTPWKPSSTRTVCPGRHLALVPLREFYY